MSIEENEILKNDINLKLLNLKEEIAWLFKIREFYLNLNDDDKNKLTTILNNVA